MFDLPVAQAMFDYLFPHPQPPQPSSSSSAEQPQQDVQELAATFAAMKKQRASRVSDTQRQQMYTQLAAEMDALPSIFLRTADCQVRPLDGLAASSAGA